MVVSLRGKEKRGESERKREEWEKRGRKKGVPRL
jgi:hypothetical protein